MSTFFSLLRDPSTTCAVAKGNGDKVNIGLQKVQISLNNKFQLRFGLSALLQYLGFFQKMAVKTVPAQLSRLMQPPQDGSSSQRAAPDEDGGARRGPGQDAESSVVSEGVTAAAGDSAGGGDGGNGSAGNDYRGQDVDRKGRRCLESVGCGQKGKGGLLGCCGSRTRGAD